MNRFLTSILFLLSSMLLLAQTGQVRGVIKNAEDGKGLGYVLVKVKNDNKGTYSTKDGIYSINKLDTGLVMLEFSALGFDTLVETVRISKDKLTIRNVYLTPSAKAIDLIQFSAAKQRRMKDVVISQTTIKPKQLQRIPTVGGEPDLVQYLQVLPGVVFSGDQGGQLYIRGGSPVMNRIMIDGMTIYNPFHSIGLFSVFDSDILKAVDVYSAGFSAEYGGRISAIVDVQTRDGNVNQFKAKLNSSPFNSKLLLEGPIRKYKKGKGSSSYVLSYKNSYLDRSAKIFYPYINQGRLPYSFSDLYAKYSVNSSNGSHFKVFGFDYNDNVNFEGTTAYNWKARGLGTKFLMIPGSSKIILDGTLNFSNYLIQQKEADNKPRESGISGYNVLLNFTNFLENSAQLKYGIEMNAFRTDFEIYNALDRRITQFQNTSEISLFINYKKIFNEKFIFEPGFRIQRYASLQENSFEPRLRMKYNLTDRIRFKGAAGLYSQNLMSAVSDRDIVNLFYGFLSGPEDLPKEYRGEEVTSKLQKASHGVVGVELDLTSDLEINLETYIKDFGQITNINRNKIFDNNQENKAQPDYLKQDYIIEEGQAYGFDVSVLYENGPWYFWSVYSYNVVNRKDEYVTYNPHFDRRHNVNLVGSYDFGKDNSWSANLRWNFGSGFPFTLTQGFYERLDFAEGGSLDYTKDNGQLGILYAQINTGRLPYYHRLDASIKKTMKWKANEESEREQEMNIILSVTNVYDRNNIFYFDRVDYQRVDQLPILPSVSVSYAL